VKYHTLCCLALLVSNGFGLVGAPAAQTAKVYRARLSPVPLDFAMMSTVSGTGTVTATVSGQTITFSGTFTGLRSPATTVILHRALRGTRGPDVATVQATNQTSGQISGTVAATPQLLQDLDHNLLYLQMQSETAPDGNLWGWFFLQDKNR
jgi:hypothetical protein